MLYVLETFNPRVTMIGVYCHYPQFTDGEIEIQISSVVEPGFTPRVYASTTISHPELRSA